MINVLVPSMGRSMFFKEIHFPKPLIEINGKTMMEIVNENLQKIPEHQMIYMFGQEDCSKFHLDSSIKLLEKDCKILTLKGQTAGALCTALVAIKYINSDIPLLIVNSDQIIDICYEDVITNFQKTGADAGILTFPSIHPRWSYAKVVGNDVMEVAEKRPLSNRAIAGIYYYKKGSDFIEAAKKAILKQNCCDEKYYISATLNELILMGKVVKEYPIQKSQYHSFYSPEKIEEFERKSRIG